MITWMKIGGNLRWPRSTVNFLAFTVQFLAFTDNSSPSQPVVHCERQAGELTIQLRNATPKARNCLRRQGIWVWRRGESTTGLPKAVMCLWLPKAVMCHTVAMVTQGRDVSHSVYGYPRPWCVTLWLWLPKAVMCHTVSMVTQGREVSHCVYGYPRPWCVTLCLWLPKAVMCLWLPKAVMCHTVSMQRGT